MKQHAATKDMTEGPITRQLIEFALPLMVGNIFQMLYNAVDSIVVGNFVGTEALAAVSATTMLTNMAVFFFNGFSVGAGVVVARFFGSKDRKQLHRSIETTMAFTFIACILFTVFGILGVNFMLHFMSTPKDVFRPAASYLRIYFAGVTGLLIYNIGSGILRAVGDTTRPLYFLILTSLMNIGLDLLFVPGFHMGIEGAAIATIISQFVSAALILRLLTRTKEVYRLTWKDIRIDGRLLRQIFAIGLPTAIQAVLTSFSNVFVQSYINHFGSAVMAGWGSYNKIDQFVFLPVQSMAMAATTFVSQNVGAGKGDRVNRGTRRSISISLLISLVTASICFLAASPLIGLFTKDPAVIAAGTLFIHTNVFFLLFNCVDNVLAGALRGRGDSAGPMVIMLTGFVVIRQIYLYVLTRWIVNTPLWVGFGYPVGWIAVCIIEVAYFYLRWGRSRTKSN